MKLLSLETSSSIFTAAVSDGPEVLQCLACGEKDKPSDMLAELIQEVMTQAKLSLQALDGFSISIGPGSFTGLRVGVTTLKTLAWALDKPVLPVSSLEVLAANVPDPQDTIMPLLDARKAKVYAAQFQQVQAGQPELSRVHEDTLCVPEDALALIKDPVILLGDGVQRYRELLKTVDPELWTIAPESLWVPRADRLNLIAAQRWPEGCVQDIHTLVPEYLYSRESSMTGW